MAQLWGGKLCKLELCRPWAGEDRKEEAPEHSSQWYQIRGVAGGLAGKLDQLCYSTCWVIDPRFLLPQGVALCSMLEGHWEGAGVDTRSHE